MKKLILLTIALPFVSSLLGMQYCHDTTTGKYRRIRPTDNPRTMQPHKGRLEFKKPHLECNPSK